MKPTMQTIGAIDRRVTIRLAAGVAALFVGALIPGTTGQVLWAAFLIGVVVLVVCLLMLMASARSKRRGAR